MILENLMLVGILVALYLGSLLLNTVLGTYNNVAQLKSEFSKEKMLAGLAKGGIVLVGALGISAMISVLPQVLEAFGVAADSVVAENISVAAIVGVMGSTIVRYVMDAVKKLYAILGYAKEGE